MESQQAGAPWAALLQTLGEILMALGYPAHLVAQSSRIPHPVLLTRLPLPDGRAALEMALSFYPVDRNQIKHTHLLHYYCELPLKTDAAGVEHVTLLLPDLNAKTVLGHFSVTPGRPVVTYRYVQALPAACPLTQSSVADVVLLVGYTPALFIDLLERVGDGRCTVHAARAQLAAGHT
jgi:hypothetical protein